MPEGALPSSPRGAIRLTFAYEGEDVRLVDRTSVEAILPSGEPGALPADASGFWVELLDASGRAIYRQTLEQPVRFDAEVFPGDHDDLPHHVSRESPRGAFVIVVPDLPEADRATLWSSPSHPERSHEAASTLLEVPLRGRRPPRKEGS